MALLPVRPRQFARGALWCLFVAALLNAQWLMWGELEDLRIGYYVVVAAKAEQGAAKVKKSTKL